ncbi:MAG: PfkB family carbohydrate kinase [Planctomycetaceae bacterium]
MSIFGIGTVVVDHAVELSHYPAEDTKGEVQHQWVQVGGPVPIALSTAAYYGSSTALLSRWGQDSAGELIRQTLTERSINLDHCQSSADWSSGFAHVWVTAETGCRTIAFSRGSFPPPDELDVSETMLKNCRILHLDGWASAAAIKAAQIVRNKGGMVVLDAGSVKPGLNALLPLVDILIASALFRRSRFGSAEVSHDDLLSLGPSDVISTDGANQSTWLTKETAFHEPAVDVHAIDTNGAGDIFSGAILQALEKRRSPKESQTFANSVAGYACGQRGNFRLTEWTFPD